MNEFKPCDPEVFDKGTSVCLVNIPKEAAENLCRSLSAVTGYRIDWHYIGGRVHVKALPAAPDATACPGHGRSECVSCCWPKGELEGKRADVVIVDEFSEVAPAPGTYTAVDMGTAAADGYRSAWIPAENPPDGEVGKWSRRVVAVTNADNVFSVSYFHGEDGGVWQRPKAMADGEQFTKWSEIPA